MSLPSRYRAIMVRDLTPLKLTCAFLLLVSAADLGAAESVPLPRPRPAQAAAEPSDPPKTEEAAEPSACRVRLTTDVAIARSLPAIVGPGECGASDLVLLEAVVMPDKSRVAFTP